MRLAPRRVTPHDIRHEHLAGLSPIANTGSELDRGTKEVRQSSAMGSPACHAHPDANLATRQPPLYLRRRQHGRRGRREVGHDPVTGMLHLSAAIRGFRSSNDFIVSM